MNVEYKTYDMTSDKMPNYTYEKSIQILNIHFNRGNNHEK